MRAFIMKSNFAPAFILALACIAPAFSAAPTLDTAKIEQITGVKGTYNEDEKVFKVSAPRTDVEVTVDGWKMPPFMGMVSWAAFTPHHSGAMVMGDIVVFQDELNPAMSAALDSGLAVTALHNHFFFDEPKVYFMHIEGEGAVDKLASGVRAVFDKINEIRTNSPQPATSFPGQRIPEKNSVTPEPLEDALGVKSQSSNGMSKVVIGRSATMHGTAIASDMGVNTWAAFGGSDDNAVVAGDFAMHEDELQRVLRSMRKEGINIVAIHSHMTEEQPRIMFLHYWGRGKAADLAQGPETNAHSAASTLALDCFGSGYLHSLDGGT